MPTLPTISEINGMFQTEKDCLDFLHSKHVFYETYNCPLCLLPMKLYKEQSCFRCNRRRCNSRSNRVSIRIGTFFYHSQMSCSDILKLAHLWLARVPVKSTILLTGHSPNTVCSFFNHFRKLVSSSLMLEDQIIGGPNVIVEVDETKLGKRKYNRGHMVEGVWVVLGIERTAERKVFMVPVPNRSSEVLSNIIQSHVLPGSIIHTDLWRGYQNLENLGMLHYTVNHSQNFKDPISGACTNTAEGTNSGLKRFIPIRNRVRKDIEMHIDEFVWRRKNEDNLFVSFIDALREIHYDIN